MLINFIPFKPNHEVLKPIPALQSLPEWYKSLRPFRNKDTKQHNSPNGADNLTVKRCNPFGDALGAGYFILLENDFEVRKNGELTDFVWTRGGNNFIDFHPKEMVAPEMIPPDYADTPFKFNNDWSIRPPKGYSLLFTHPLNRYDLPFLTLSGIVDADSYKLPVNLPFLLRKDFEGIIESGTPIAQVIPFKRESWKHKIEQFDEKSVASENSNFYRTMNRFYKRFAWHRKEYK